MKVYLDNAATTPLAPEVFAAIAPVLKNDFGNPSSTHFFGRSTKALIEQSRRSVAKHINCQASEIIFTSGGTEADNMALFTSVSNLGVERIITSYIEHHAVGHTAVHIHKEFNIQLDYVDVDESGNIDLVHLEVLLKDQKKKTLVSLMHANNEIGTLLPIQEVSVLCRENDAYFHSDTVQTMGHYTFDLNELDIDFITCAAHKFHGPKGIGFLYVNKHIHTGALIHGGAQERGLRGGTENVSGIVGLSKAMDLAYEDLEAHQKHVYGLKEHMVNAFKANFSDISFHGEISWDKSLYTVLNVCFPETEKASMLLFTLDLKGIAVSGGSACSSGSSKGSHVLDGIGANPNRPNARFSFSRYNRQEEIEYVVEQVVAIFRNKIV
ncbi:MAG: cysteine desulfurase family protein [Crocinitomicaceae bacterium]|tara:strand:- start:4147 stop:5289 length:1143 start_codon:yes stop_codon:yes gene_type:complete